MSTKHASSAPGSHDPAAGTDDQVPGTRGRRGPTGPALARRQVLTGAAYVTAGTVIGLAAVGCTSSDTPSEAGAQTTTSAPPVATNVTTVRPATPEQAFEALKAGNERYATGQSLHPNQGIELRQSYADTQNPFIAVLSCADSRVVPELIFDQGISDVFDVRVAGNIADPAGIASLVYAVEVLGVDLITVMGHTNCGAVKAAIDVSTGKMPAGEFAPLTNAIMPAVELVQPTSNSGVALQETIDANARLQVEVLTRSSPALAAAVSAGTLTIMPSAYDLESGRVRLLG